MEGNKKNKAVTEERELPLLLLLCILNNDSCLVLLIVECLFLGAYSCPFVLLEAEYCLESFRSRLCPKILSMAIGRSVTLPVGSAVS